MENFPSGQAVTAFVPTRMVALIVAGQPCRPQLRSGGTLWRSHINRNFRRPGFRLRTSSQGWSPHHQHERNKKRSFPYDFSLQRLGSCVVR